MIMGRILAASVVLPFDAVDTSKLSAAAQHWLSAGRHVDANRMQIFVYERGSGPAVLLMHGFPTSCYDFRGVIDRLADSYRCVAFDFPGYGLSAKPTAYSYSLFQQTDVVEALANALGIREAHVVSHDVGTSVHTELLARVQDGRLGFHIASSTFLNGSMLQWLATITPFQKLLSNNETLDQAIALCESAGAQFVQGLKSVMKRPECLTDADAELVTELMLFENGNQRLPALSGYMRERFINKERWIGALRAMPAPAQIVWADGDPVANIEMGRALHAELPGARYTELQGLGHFLPMEDPNAVAEEIRTFIEALK
jgi:pimeloyl-ACP methyl ester carboxylesterase